jgi:hypothetical protein
MLNMEIFKNSRNPKIMKKASFGSLKNLSLKVGSA